ncbi:MAG: hypothetical protein Q4B54_08870, partial [Coriobacteriales bacterium]|nr:hypothetical protein [Coriobacteriales bacterium]
AEEDLATAPDERAYNYLACIAGRSDLTEREVKAALAKYNGHVEQLAIIAAATRSQVDAPSTTRAEHELEVLDAFALTVADPYTLANIKDMTDAQEAAIIETYEEFVTA